MYDLLIQDATVLQFHGDTLHFLPNHAIAIQDQRIAAITSAISAGLAREIIDAQGMLAIPGLINAHAHTAMSLLRGVAEDEPIERWFNDYIWLLEHNLTDEDIYWGMLLGLAEMIESGVTTVADHYFAMDEAARAVERSGLRALLAWTMFGGEDADQQLRRAAAFVEQWNGVASGRIRAWLGPHAPYTCTPEFLATVAQAAKDLGVGIHIHLSETADQVRQSFDRYSRTPVAIAYASGLFDVPALAAHVAHPGDGDLDILRANGVGVAVCPKTSMKLAMGVAPVAEMRQYGIAVGVGSDGAASNNTYDILEATRLLALIQKHDRRDPQALPINEALTLATSEGARALRLDGVTGELREGLQADIALLRLDGLHLGPTHDLGANLLYSARASDVDAVIVAGRILMRERRLLTIDKAQVTREVSARVERLLHHQDRRRIQTYMASD